MEDAEKVLTTATPITHSHTGVPLIFFVVMYTYREDSVKLIEGLKKYDEKHQRFSFVSDVADLTALVATTTTEPQQATAGKERRPSIAAQANDLMWLSNKLDKFEPLMWWASGYLIAMRIIQTSMMVFITNPSLQASVASLIWNCWASPS